MQSQRNTDGQREPEVHYTAFIRLPFPRGDFVDPPQVHWTATKNRALWRILMDTPGGVDFDWKELASRFEVTIPFILRQTAWLYERQMLQVRAHMRRAGNSSASSPTPALGSASLGSGHAMRRLGSADGPRAASSLSNQAREQPNAGDDTSVPNTPRLHAPTIRRNLSSSTVTQSRQFASKSPSQRPKGSFRTPGQEHRKMQGQLATAPETAERSLSPSEESSESSSSSSESSDGNIPYRSQALKRPSYASPAKAQARGGIAEEEDEESPAFLPFAMTEDFSRREPRSEARSNQSGLAAVQKPSTPTRPVAETALDSSGSSANSSAAFASQRYATKNQTSAGPINPQYRAGKSNVHSRGHGVGRQGSDAPSADSQTSSSFSELDDASVTQSALEEALLSNMQHGGTTSKMSTISQALKSRYM